MNSSISRSDTILEEVKSHIDHEHSLRERIRVHILKELECFRNDTIKQNMLKKRTGYNHITLRHSIKKGNTKCLHKLYSIAMSVSTIKRERDKYSERLRMKFGNLL